MAGELAKHPQNNGEPLDCYGCDLDMCMSECKFDAGLEDIANVSQVELEKRIVRATKTIIDQTENGMETREHLKYLLSLTLKTLVGDAYEGVLKKITPRINKVIAPIKEGVTSG